MNTIGYIICQTRTTSSGKKVDVVFTGVEDRIMSENPNDAAIFRTELIAEHAMSKYYLQDHRIESIEMVIVRQPDFISDKD